MNQSFPASNVSPMNNLLAYMQQQAQPSSSGAPQISTMPQMPQQPFQFAMQGWPAQTTQGLGAQPGQQWPAMQSQLHAAFMQAQLPQVPVQQPNSIAEFAAALAEAMRTHVPNTTTSSAPVGSIDDDERILIHALRVGKDQGLSPRQAIEKLHSVNTHTEIGWKNYFLEHLERLYPILYRRGVEVAADPPSALSRHSSTASRPTRPSLLTRPASAASRTIATAEGLKNKSQESRQRPSGSHSKTNAPKTPVSPSQERNKISSGERSRRAGTVFDSHGGTYIPPRESSLPPKAPQRDPNGPNSNKFDDDDKVFFIHFLRWRLRRGVVPSKWTLAEELAEKTPHHNADAWQRHWHSEPFLPDKILIQARKREGNWEEDGPASRERPANAPHGGEVDAEEDEYTSEEERDEPVQPAVSRRHVEANKKKHRPPVRVTEEDLRAMARYKVEYLDVWDQYGSDRRRWENFWTRPGNSKRSIAAWASAARDHASEFGRYFAEYLAAEPSQSARPTPHIDIPRGPLSQPVNHRSISSISQARKRAAEEPIPEGGSRSLPPEKRTKQDVIDLSG